MSFWTIVVQDGPHAGARFAMDVRSMRITIPMDAAHEILGRVDYDLWLPDNDKKLNVEPELHAWHHENA